MNEDMPDDGALADPVRIDGAAEVFALLADPTRVRIILALRHGELSVGHLAAVAGKSPSVISQHLAKLRLRRLVCVRREGTKAFYALTSEHALTLVNQAIFQAGHLLDPGPPHHQPDPDLRRAPAAAARQGAGS